MILKNLYIVGDNNTPQTITIEGDRIIPNGSSVPEDPIDLEGSLAFPGLINSHDHLEFNLYPRLGHKLYSDYIEWGNDIHVKDKDLIETIEAVPTELRMGCGVIKNLLCGVTSVAHHGAYNAALDDSPVSIIRKGTCIHSTRLGGKWKLKINYPINKEPYVIHTGEGINSDSFEEISELLKWNLFNRKLIGIHAIAMNEDQSKNFSALIWCPDSNLFLFGKTADIPLLKQNTKILFGTDSALTADRNMFENLRTARKMNMLSDEELFKCITINAAEVWELKDTGRLSAGYCADVVIAKKKSADIYDSFFNTDPEDISLILKSGKVILFDESLKHKLNYELDQNKFERMNINGKVKYVAFRITEIMNELKRYNLLLPFIEEEI